VRYLKKANIYIGIILSVIVMVSATLVVRYFLKDDNRLIYNYKQSTHGDFYFENGYVVFRDVISVKNTSSKDLYFNMSADISEDNGLAAENTAFACAQNSFEREKFFIKANSEQTYPVYFKAKKGAKNTKLNRLPPKRVYFDIQ
jgi:hypothetical protein